MTTTSHENDGGQACIPRSRCVVNLAQFHYFLNPVCSHKQTVQQFSFPNQSAEQAPIADHRELASDFQVVSKLGTGSYAIVYLVREVLSRSPPSEDDHVYPGGRLELDDTSSM